MRSLFATPLILAATAIGGAAPVALAQSTDVTAAVMAKAGDRAPRVYFAPMRGQMGTDIHPSIYEELVRDVRQQDPDLIVFMLNAADVNTVFYLNNNNPIEQSLIMLGEYRQIVKTLREDLRDIPQVMWVEDSVGFGSLMALAWPDMYMSSTARLAGLGRVLTPVLGWRDADVRAKMLAAWVGIANGFLETGGYPLVLGDAMMRPERMLSVSFEGRNVTWRTDTDGHWVIDGNDKVTTTFTAQLAEDVGLAKGIADEPDDLMFLLGFREYETIETSGQIIERYVEDWRRTLEQTNRWALDYVDALRYASGDDELRYLGQAVQSLQRILGAMNRYEAVEIRWRLTRGEDRASIQIMIEQLQERIRSIRQRGRGGRAGGGGGGVGGLGGAGRPR